MTLPYLAAWIAKRPPQALAESPETALWEAPFPAGRFAPLQRFRYGGRRAPSLRHRRHRSLPALRPPPGPAASAPPSSGQPPFPPALIAWPRLPGQRASDPVRFPRRCAIAAAAPTSANATVLSKPRGPVMRTRTPPRNGSRRSRLQTAARGAVRRPRRQPRRARRAAENPLQADTGWGRECGHLAGQSRRGPFPIPPRRPARSQPPPPPSPAAAFPPCALPEAGRFPAAFAWPTAFRGFGLLATRLRAALQPTPLPALGCTPRTGAIGLEGFLDTGIAHRWPRFRTTETSTLKQNDKTAID